MNFVQSLSAAMRGSSAKPNPGGNDGSRRAILEQAHKAAAEHYGNVLRSTNDAGERKTAHDALMKATEALGNSQ